MWLIEYKEKGYFWFDCLVVCRVGDIVRGKWIFFGFFMIIYLFYGVFIVDYLVINF